MCLAACGRGTQSQVTATPSSAAATPSAVTAKPSAGISPAGAAHRTAAPAAGPRPALRPAYHGGRPAAAAQPKILAASVNPSVVGSGTVVTAVVRTTPGVVSVVAYAAGGSIAVPRVGLGLFAGSTTIPQLPPFARGSYAVTFIARDSHGASTQSAVGVRVR
jgi:hypothetical protein